ncbi:MAG: hypothetical protein WD226_00965 [Planctomycetota bacterium]
MSKLVLALALSLTACVSPSESDAVRPYPLDTCIVMDSKLGSMGDPIVQVYEGQEIKFCCKPCVEEFHEDPEFFMTKLEEATAGE